MSCLMSYVISSYDLKALVYVLFLGLRLTIKAIVFLRTAEGGPTVKFPPKLVQ